MDRCCAERALTELHVGAAVQQGQGTHVDVAPQITSPCAAAQHAGFGRHVGVVSQILSCAVAVNDGQ